MVGVGLSSFSIVAGKVFPKLKRRVSQGEKEDKAEGEAEADQEDETEDIASDYVFRIISMTDKPDTISK